MRNVSRTIGLTALLLAPALASGQQPRTDDMKSIPPGGRACANALIRLVTPEPPGDKPVIVDILDPHGQIVWTGATRTPTFSVFTRDWADGTYTVRFDAGKTQELQIDSAFFGAIRARCGLLLRAIEEQRDPDGMAPDKLHGASNLLQRIMTLFVRDLPKQDVDGHLHFCEQQIGFRTATAIARLLGSGASNYLGYDGPYRRFHRERSSMFMPPNAVLEFAANAERKLARWGYGPKDVEHIIVTHEHLDHFDPVAVAGLAAKRRDLNLDAPTLHSGKTVCKQMREHLDQIRKPDLVRIDELTAFTESTAGEITIKPVLATHTAGPDPLCYILRWRGVTVYFGTDTGYPKAETLAHLSRERFDLFVHECTVASADDGVTHCDLGDLILLIGKLRAAGAIDTWTRIATIHQAPDGPQSLPDNLTFERMAGFECGYDGMPLPIAYRDVAKPD